MSNPERLPQYITDLANIFIGGRISGWVERNHDDIKEIELLLDLCPNFREATQDLNTYRKRMAIGQALNVADCHYLSATNYEPISRDSWILKRKQK